MDFPHIDGVEFKHIPHFPGYAVSSNGEVWIGMHGPWRKMSPFPDMSGRKSVMLNHGVGRIRVYVDELVKDLFGETNA